MDKEEIYLLTRLKFGALYSFGNTYEFRIFLSIVAFYKAHWPDKYFKDSRLHLWTDQSRINATDYVRWCKEGKSEAL